MEEINILYTLEYLRDHKNEVDWYNVSMFANLSEEFILEFYDNLKWVNILFNETLTDELYDKFQKELGLDKCILSNPIIIND